MFYFSRRARRLRQKQKAQKGLDVVKACSTRMHDKVMESLHQRSVRVCEAEKTKAEIYRRSDAGEDRRILEIMAGDYESLMSSIKLSDETLDIIRIAYYAMIDLEVVVEQVMHLEWYTYIIGAIPTKRLPDLMNSEGTSGLREITSLANEICQKIQDKLFASIQDKEEADRLRRRIHLVAEERKGSFDSSSESALDRLLADRDRPEPTGAVKPDHDVADTAIKA